MDEVDKKLKKFSTKDLNDKIGITLELVEEYWRKNPDFTLGQIVASAVNSPIMPSGHIYNFSNDLMLERLEELNGSL